MNKFKDKILSDKSYMVMAGAGAGKTTRLVAHIVENFMSFKSKHGKWPRIVGTTFTKKAASEIQDRVSVLYKSYNDPEIFDFAYSNHLNIGTIHSLCLQLLRSKYNYLGFTQDLKITNSESLQFEQKRILYEIINSDYKSILTAYGFNSLTSIINFIGKRKEINFKPISMDYQNEILKNTITNAHDFLKLHLENISISHMKDIKNADVAYSYLQSLEATLLESKIQNDFLPTLMFFQNNPYTKPRFKLKSIEAQSAWEDIWEFRNSLKSDLEKNFIKTYNKSSFELLTKYSSDIFDIEILYRKKLYDFKKKSSLIEMSDIEPLTLDLLKNHKENCKDFIKQWDYYYIDEYQDTNSVQKEIFDILLEDVSFFKVGDPQQSIYLFRGAKSSIYEQEFEVAKDNNEISIDFLKINYRSEKNLLMGVNELFEHIDSTSFKAMEAFKEDTNKSNDLEDNTRIFININMTDDLEKSSVIKLIKNKIQSGVKLSEICILARTKSLLYQFEAELQKEKIPSVLLISGNYENRIEVRQSLLFLSFLENPDDDLKLFAILKSKIFEITDDQLALLFKSYKDNKSWSLWSFMKSQQSDKLDCFLKLNEYLEIYKKYGTVPAFKRYLLKSNILSLAKNEMDLNRRHSNLYKLFTEIINESLDTLTLSESLKSILSKKVKSQTSEAIFSSSNSGVKLMTIHGSKGLEFEEVIVVGGHIKGNLTYTEAVEVDDQGVFVAPFTDINKNEKVSGPLLTKTKTFRVSSERQETLRQIYVAATRAKKHLYFFGQSRLGDNSIYRNFKLDEKPNFKWLKIIDHQAEKSENNFESRNWDFDSYSNNLDFFESPFKNSVQDLSISSMGDQDLDSAHLSNDKNNLDFKALNNISVTAMVKEYSETNNTFNFTVIKEQSFTSFNVQNSNRDFEKILIGDLFHKYFELYAKGVDQEALKSRFQKTYLGDLTGLSYVIDSLFKLDSPNFKDIFKNCNIEWGFNSSITDGVLISGQIDLWGFDSRGVLHIVDYKTGKSLYQKKAAIQLGIYQKVLTQIYPKSEVQTHILYISEGKLVTIKGQQLQL